MKPVVIVTGADLAPQALDLLAGYEVVYAGKTPLEDDIAALCRVHDPVAIIVRFGRLPSALAGGTLRPSAADATGSIANSRSRTS